MSKTKISIDESFQANTSTLYNMSDSKTSIDNSTFQEVDDYNDSSDGLEIDISDSPKPKDKINIEDKHVLENIEEEIERQYDEKAAKSNLSAINVKNILRHVITNEHVWAMVRNTEDGNGDAETIYEPKFTRSKTKELLQTRKMAASIPWMMPKQTSEVQEILVNEELPEDSDDDEYIPNDDDSEIDSQPRTPATPSSMHDTSTQTIWTEDGVFKVPGTKTPIPQEDVANIALRTRSKFSLSDTPLEVIEEALIPPDITTDMYDLECDDEDWKDFLKKFTRPLDEAMHGTQEDDDELDPEYNVLADEAIDKLDKEELRMDRAVKISKKELNNLVAELFEFSEMFSNTKEFEDIEIPAQSEIINDTTINQSANVETTEFILPETIEVQQSFLPDQLLLFEQQMRQHVQMLAQNFVLSYQHQYVGDYAETFKNMLLSLFELSKYKTNTAFKSCNLNLAAQFINDWQHLIDSNSADVLEMKKQMSHTYTQYYRKKSQHRKQTTLKLPTLVLQKISQSPVFMYPSLLPPMPFKSQYTPKNDKMPVYLPSEDELIAIGLEQFYEDLEKDEKYIKRCVVPRIPDLAYYIAKYTIPIGNQRKICGRIRQLKSRRAPANPIKYFFENKQAPRTIHYVENVAKLGMLPPLLRPANLLPSQWKEFIYPSQLDLLNRARKVQKPPPFNKGQSTKKQRLLIPKSPGNSENPIFLVTDETFIPTTKKTVKTKTPKKVKTPTFEQIYLNEIELVPDPIKNEQQPLLDVEDLIPENIINKSDIQVSINNLDNTRIVSFKSKKIDLLKFNTDKMLPSMPFLLTPQKDTQIIQNDLEISEDDKSPPQAVDKPLKQDDETDEKKDDEDELNALMVASTTLQQKNKRIQTNLTKKAKQMKQYNATLAMLCPEDTTHLEEKAKNYAQAYYDKVQERLECESPVEYQRFMEVLNEHDETSTVSNLYEKVSSVLSPKHPDLCEEFLTFLTAEQAQLIGKLVPHFMLSNMSLFLRKLEIYYNNQPAQLRRIFNCLTELAEMKDVTMDKIRSTILPLLKGNTLLINWFLQLFPKETPPESSMTDWEEINCDDDDVDDNDKLYETLKLPEVEDPYGGPNCICKCHQIDDEMYKSRNRHCIPCGTKFLQGRVYIQTGKGLRLANVTFNSTSTEHSKRLNIKTLTRQKRKSETSPHKPGFMSPTKDDEPRHSNESEDDAQKARGNSPPKTRKKTTNKSTPKLKKDTTKPRPKLEPVSPKKAKTKIKNTEENSNSPCKETLESDCDWEKTSPGPSIESVDTCEESSQDTIPAQGSESDDSIGVESVISDNSEDSNDDNDNTHSWTRDEDKVILETFQQSAEEQKAFKEIQMRLPDRTISEIRQRFRVLMSLLQEMAAK